MNIRKLTGTELAIRHGNAHATVAPHGIIGQSYDNDTVAVNGKLDDYFDKSNVVTSAMAEGAIEGVADDYVVDSPHDTRFRFTRFDSHGIVKPRNASLLSGRLTAAGSHEDSIAGSTL